MEYSLTSAASATGSSKSKIHRMIKDGRLSARRLDDGSYRIDASELGRVFSAEPLKPSQREAVRRDETVAEPSGTELMLLRLQVQMLEDQLAREREDRSHERELSRDTVSDLRKRLDRAEERILALAPPGAPQTAQEGPSASLAALEPPRRSKGLLSRLMGW